MLLKNDEIEDIISIIKERKGHRMEWSSTYQVDN